MKYFKHTKQFINDWAKIWIWCITLICFVNMMMIVYTYAYDARNKIANDFKTYCDTMIEKELEKYE